MKKMTATECSYIAGMLTGAFITLAMVILVSYLSG